MMKVLPAFRLGQKLPKKGTTLVMCGYCKASEFKGEFEKLLEQARRNDSEKAMEQAH